MNNIQLIQQAYATPWAVIDTPTKRASHPLRFGQAEDTVTWTTPRQRRATLYLDFLQRPVLQAEEKTEKLTYYSGIRDKYSNHDRGNELELELDTPESIKALLEKRPLMTLPHGYKPNFSQRQALEAPYKLPNRDQLLSLGPGRTLHVSIPPLQEKNIQVRPPEVSPYMDMNEGSIASTMVAAGLQPSEIAEEYQANWSPEKVSRDILQNFFDSHGQTLEGVRIEVQRLATSGKNINTDSHPAFRVKIYGRGQYAFEKAYVLGDSDKQEDDVNAGGFRRPENHRTQLSSGLWCTLCQNVFCQLGNDLYAARRTRVRRKYTPII